MEIKTVGPFEVASPTKNEDAREAYNSGNNFLDENNLAEAEKCFKKALALDPLYVDAMDHLGLVYRRQQRLSSAEEIYKKSIEINSKNKVPYINLAIVLKMQDRLDEVFDLYKKVMEIDPNDPETYFGLGELFLYVDEYEKALVFNDKAIELYMMQKSPYLFDAFYHKGIILYRMNEFEKAIKYLEEAKKGNPNLEAIDKLIIKIKDREK